jgi:hypothetical protein
MYLHAIPGIIGGIVSAIVTSKMRGEMSDYEIGAIYEINNNYYRTAS